MTAPVDTRLKGRTRWSMTARCPRQGAMGLLGYEPDDPSPEVQLLWERGNMDEDWVVEKILIPEYGFDNIIRQKAVEWPRNGLPIGELHTDAFIVSNRLPVEIKSHAGGEATDADFMQLAGQIHFDEEADDGGVLIVVDRGLGREYLPLKLDSEWRDRVEDAAAQVVTAGTTGELPARTCARPSDGIGKMCPFIDQCFAGWEAPDPLVIVGDHAQLLAETFHLKETRDRLKQPYAEADSAYKAACSELSELGLPDGIEVHGGGVIAKKTVVPDREMFSVKDARRGGAWTSEHDEAFAAYLKRGGGSTRWTLKRDKDAPLLAQDFGDEAPWTDADLAAPLESF